MMVVENLLEKGLREGLAKLLKLINEGKDG
jgi:hypothetical protein